jgi:adenosylhomocysteinase
MRTKIIQETISVEESGDALCLQEITYKNHGVVPLIFYGNIKTSFHKNCEGFKFIEEPGIITADIVDEDDQPYQKDLKYYIPQEIPPEEHIILKLRYTWKNFKSKAGFERIVTEFDSLTDYNLLIKVCDTTFSDYLITVLDGLNPLEQNKDYFVTEENNLKIIRQHLSSNSKQDIKIITEIEKIPLLVISDTAKEYNQCFSKRYCILLILHLLRDFIFFCDELLKMGVNKNDLFIVGIPYSSKDNVIEHLKHKSYKVYSIGEEAYIKEFNKLIENVVKKALEHCQRANKKLLIIEDGGYAVPLIHEKFMDSASLCIGAVEQTANGIWVDRELEGSGKLSFPVMNVAESKIKEQREAPLISHAIIHNINILLGKYGEGITDMKVGQIGFGTIGKPLALQMKNYGVDLTVYDIDEEKRNTAKTEGISTVTSLNKLVEGKNFIIGCSGRELIGLEELRSADQSIFFVNATSKLKELKYEEFIKNVDQAKIKSGVGTEYKLKGGRRITIRLLANGFPINFFEDSQSVPDKQIQFIYAVLLGSAATLVKNQISEAKIIDIPKELQDTINHFMESRK